MNKIFASAALALTIGLATGPALADPAFDLIQHDLLGSAPLPSDIVDVDDANGISWGEVGDFLNAIPQIQASALERRCLSAVRLRDGYLAASLDFCGEYLNVLRDIERADEAEDMKG
jgi:hypothetical protein